MSPSSWFSRSMHKTKSQTLQQMETKDVTIHGYNGIKGA